MITGSELRDARSRAGLTQEQLAEQIGTTLRSIGNWERGSGVPRNREGAVRDILGANLVGQTSNPLASVSDVALLAELGRRLARSTDAGQATADPDPDRNMAEFRQRPRDLPPLELLAADEQDGPTAQQADEDLRHQHDAGEEDQDGPEEQA